MKDTFCWFYFFTFLHFDARHILALGPRSPEQPCEIEAPAEAGNTEQ